MAEDNGRAVTLGDINRIWDEINAMKRDFRTILDELRGDQMNLIELVHGIDLTIAKRRSVQEDEFQAHLRQCEARFRTLEITAAVQPAQMQQAVQAQTMPLAERQTLWQGIARPLLWFAMMAAGALIGGLISRWGA